MLGTDYLVQIFESEWYLWISIGIIFIIEWFLLEDKNKVN
jgi:hypothetical protein